MLVGILIISSIIKNVNNNIIYIIEVCVNNNKINIIKLVVFDAILVSLLSIFIKYLYYVHLKV